ncbi:MULTISPECIES: hypothetical protein [Sphingomonadales]|uniref:Tetratricopeptide (TPR) repeat protein n=5 Tax=Sphingomonadaceae TaxID=41297 RepID=A0A7W6LS97_9SPHN|nr:MULTISPECIES: hypothetical protein [Sphingomonadaceae]MBB4149544.1 tetratricopeptide (TPR) repeat protein [Sphingobium scionense]MAX16162.1 hypothetical protein [Sphingobium sp.]MDV3480927.1 hypothetical protein [Sphingobium yanoikuyae]SMP75789.1 ST7 protein [Novosphingobium panipatense]HUD92539.1 hypothetical protein [Sphingobium sp.]
MAGLFGRVEADTNGAVDDAQEMMYDAWEASGAARVALARAALDISPLCADAYVLLAEEDARSQPDALALYRQGVEAGERALGNEFEELSGHFWGFLQTRPYMRARAGLAMTLWRTGEQQAAIDHYRAMLILNPNDNQGIRYLLASALLQRDDLAGLKVLLRQYEGDGSAAWAYTLALIAYREQDPRGPAIVREAWESNSHVPAMLAGLKRLVPSRDGYISMGGEDEATAYVEENGAAWRAIPGAIDWLAERSTGLKPRHRGCQS